MSDALDRTEAFARTILYEGYALFPYRTTSLKNARRLGFGDLAPGASFSCELLFAGAGAPRVEVRWLHEVPGEGWRPAREQRASIARVELSESGARTRVRVTVQNDADVTMGAAHAIVRLPDGATAVSLADAREQGVVLEQRGVWPIVLDARTVMLSPILVDDYPQLAAESAGDMFDATENDELLVLSVLALSDDEKAQMRAMDPRTRAILEQAESMGERMRALHGTKRGLRPGDRVRIAPRKARGANRSDVLDVVLAGRRATVESVQQTVDDDVWIAVVVDDDPGKDLGEAKMIGHRFFFAPDELEVIA